MKSFPMFFRTTGRKIVIFGGDETAAQKARLAGKTDAQVVLVAHALNEELQGLVHSASAAHHAGPVTADLFADAAFTFIATGCPGADAAIHAFAKAHGATVNVVDQPALCDIITPSIVDRDPVVVAIGTEGTAPVLGRSVKTSIEAMLPKNVGKLAALAGKLRDDVARHVPKDARRAFWAWVFKSAPYRHFTKGAEAAAKDMITSAIKAGGAPAQQGAGRISIIQASKKASDLLTLRAVERLQEADLVVHDEDTDESVLELARRDAERLALPLSKPANVWQRRTIIERFLKEAGSVQSVAVITTSAPAELPRDLAQGGFSVEVVPTAIDAPASHGSEERKNLALAG